MNSRTQPDSTIHIVEKAKAFGASMAGITSITSLQNAPSYEVYGNAEWPVEAKSLIVLAQVHEISVPELDWWDDKNRGTPGDRQLGSIANSLRQWLNEELNIDAWSLPYHIEKGGIFLKDAAALAGLGTMGKNNLLITPEFGPRIRLRALLLNVDLEPTGPIDFTPCEACNMPCRRVCPQKAFKNDSYNRILCNEQMKTDEMNRVIFKKSENNNLPSICIKYCRACELACPADR